jgi:hypothetical protein
MQDKCLHDSLSQAIRLAKNNGINEKLIKPMMLDKQKYKKICANNIEKVLRGMQLSTNVVQIEDGWYAIRYVNNNHDTMVKIDILRSEDVYLLRRDARHERELSRDQLDTLLPGLIDEEALELYKQKLATRAVELVFEYTNVYVDESNSPIDDNSAMEEVTTVSTHAGRRWVQRVIGIKNETEAEEYRRANMQAVNNAVMEGYNDAELVWEEKADNITYWFDSQNNMYVKGRQNGVPNIITMYEEDFGFSKTINRMITFEQLAVLGGARDELSLAQEDVEGTSAQVESDVQAINDEIAVLEARIALLVSERGAKLALRDQSSKRLRLAKDKYTAEFNKLFKKWDA